LDIRVVLGDDDAGMRLLIRKALEKSGGFEIIGEAEDGEAVLSLVESLKPKVVFLDVEMPKLDGVECSKRIMDIDPQTIIVFATAHNEYMPEAFEVYAFDYIVKPFKLDRLQQTLKRIKESLQAKDSDISVKKVSVQKAFKKLSIKNKEGISFIDTKDIILIQREDRSTVLFTSEDSYSTSESLSDLEHRIDLTTFFRCHKSYIINLSMIQKIYPYGRWTYLVKLKNTDKDALLTHDKYEELKKIFDL
jgi:two-component system LytT family response regulator